MTVSSCVFCRIDGDQPADVLFASDTVMAFRDIAPQAPVHVQVIPKEHLSSAAEVEDRHAGMLADLFHAARQVARAEGLGIGAGGSWRTSGPRAASTSTTSTSICSADGR